LPICRCRELYLLPLWVMVTVWTLTIITSFNKRSGGRKDYITNNVIASGNTYAEQRLRSRRVTVVMLQSRD
jgi:hypothetical protein